MLSAFRLACSWFPGFGSRSLRRLGEHGEWSEWWTAPRQSLLRIGLSEQKTDAFLSWRSKIDPANLVRQLEKEDMQVLFPDDNSYPQTLIHSVDRPEILFLRGTLPSAPAIAVVGSRKMTSYGKACTEMIVSGLAQRGFAIVSGLALGLDACAHQTCLDAGQMTVGVLGCGVDDASIYPATHRALAKRVIGQGALMSEFPPGTEARKEFFPMRNRIIAAYTVATIVVEADVASGSLITAKCALEEGREVLAVPGSILSPQSRGTHQLLRSGAQVCTSPDDVLAALQMDQPMQIAEARQHLPLSAQERGLLDKLREPLHIDQLIRTVEGNSADISAMISTLELKGFIRSIASQTWVAI